ncbi:MAG: hypothetical protein LBQ79_03600 [Deltaproteobacteria bacterium]|jgi:hypothetical protein|nr:hypothetical protein [Deltaproteobacteria bacterium]
MIKTHLATATAILIGFLFIFTGGCSGGDAAKTPPSFGKGETIATSVDSFVLHDVLFAPEYDTSGGDKGYAVVFLKKSDTANIIMNFNNPNVHKSAVDLYLLDGENSIRSGIINFEKNVDDQNFRGKMTISFRLPSDAAFPKQGVLTVEDRGTTESYQVDFSGIETTETLEAS